MQQEYFVYILTNERKTTFYIGVTNDISRRFFEHSNKINPGSFSAKYNLDILVYFESYSYIDEAIQREKQLKGGSRKKKTMLIENFNPEWDNLFEK